MKRTILIISGILLTLSSLASCVNTPQVEEEKTFKVTWKNEDGTILQVDSKVKEGELPSFDGETPSKDNDEYYSYSFKGWNKELEPVYSDITYIAQYEKIELVYTVTWENYDGTILEVDENIKKGSIPEYNGETPTRENDENYRYSFKGWDKVLNPIEENITFKAVFDTAPSIYTVRFLNYDGTLLQEFNNINFNEFVMFYQKKSPQKESDTNNKYIFNGRSPSIKEITEDTTYTAQFKSVNLHSDSDKLGRIPTKDKGQIFIYGETHGDQGILEEEFDIRHNYYKSYGFRHLLIEFSVVTAEKLNAYLRSDTDEIWNTMFMNFIESKASCATIHFYYFIKKIKENCPETIFHGIDVAEGHGNDINNIVNYLNSLIKKGELNKDLFEKAKNNFIDAIFYNENRGTKDGESYREEKMAENVLNEFNSLKNYNVMGIFGSAHTDKNGSNFFFKNSPNMGNMLDKNIGYNLYSESLDSFANGDRTKPDKDFIENELGYKDPSSIDLNSYEYIYLGKKDMTNFSDLYKERTFYLVENAYEDFKNIPLTGEVLPFDNYPVEIELNNVYAIDYLTYDNEIVRKYYRSDPNQYYEGKPTTVCVDI